MSESDIDMDRCLLGIDDEKACVPEITWTNCAKQTPPDTGDKFIFKDEWGYWYMYVCKGKDYITGYRSQDRVSYTPYTPEKWEELNK